MVSSLQRLAALVSTSPQTRAETDLALWKTWKKSPTDTNLSALLHQVKPLVHAETTKWAGTLARPMLMATGQQLAVEAFHSYDPDKGAALGTHVANRLLKMSRVSYSNQNAARLPENKMLKFHTYKVGHAELTDQFGRAPTVDEIADHLGWSIPHVKGFQKDIAHQEILESGGTSDAMPPGMTGGQDEEDHMVDFIHHDLPPPQKAIFEHLTGYGGTPILSNQEIMKKLNLSQGQYSYSKRLLVDHLENVTKGR